MIDIEALMVKFCQVGARALCRYASISGEDPSTAPEYFMAAFIMNELGNSEENGRRLAFTLESTFSALWQWNGDAKQRSGDLLPTELVKLGEELSNPRVDMVLFEGKLGVPKDQFDFLALVEFKKGDLERGGDREKLLRLLTHIDTCPYGIACGWVENREDYIAWQKKHARRCQDAWFEAKVERIPSGREYVFCVRLFSREALHVGPSPA